MQSLCFWVAEVAVKRIHALALMRHFKKKHYVTKTFLLCPLRHSNDLYTNLKTLDEKYCFEDEHTFGLALHQILTTVQKEWDKYNVELEYENVFLKSPLKSFSTDSM